MMAELYGKKTGTNKGKGGSMHIADYDVGMLGPCGIVGGGIPIITGAGLSARIRETYQVAVSFFGDGAVNQGSFHESLNLASVLKLPVIYVCENNLYGEGTPLKEHVQITQIADRAKSYNMPQSTVDGNDVMAVYNSAEEAVLRARKGKGPTLIECITYRWRPHAEGYPLREMYLGREVIEKELSEWKKNCPLQGFQTKLISKGALKEEQIGEIYLEARKNVEEAVKHAEQSPYPGLEEAFEDIYAM
jgi:TPP-dependent pyruvate/acetoin dehydrogenase alpha subunit